MQQYVAKDIMNAQVIAVPTTMDLRDLGKLFLDKGITGAPVIDERGELAGVISQTDLVYYNLTRDDELSADSHFYQNARVEGQHLPQGFQIEDVNTGCVADVMTPVVHSVTESTSVRSVVRMMTRQHIHRVIVRRGRKVAGVISVLDVLRIYDRAADKLGARRAKAASAAPRARTAKARPAAKRKAVKAR